MRHAGGDAPMPAFALARPHVLSLNVSQSGVWPSFLPVFGRQCAIHDQA
jgi:hypothetical protein